MNTFEMLVALDIDKKHSPKEVENLLSVGLSGNENDLNNIISMITVDEFRRYMKSKGFVGEYSRADFSFVSGCSAEQSLYVFNILNKRLISLHEISKG